MPKTVINKTTTGTQIIVVQVIERAVTFLLIPYGTKNMLVLVIGRIEFITITASHPAEINPTMYNNPKTMDILSGVITTVIRNIFLTHDQ
jgi:hypothetical protein